MGAVLWVASIVLTGSSVALALLGSTNSMDVLDQSQIALSVWFLWLGSLGRTLLLAGLALSAARWLVGSVVSDRAPG